VTPPFDYPTSSPWMDQSNTKVAKPLVLIQTQVHLRLPCYDFCFL